MIKVDGIRTKQNLKHRINDSFTIFVFENDKR